MALLELTEGWTGRLGPFTLTVDGEPFNLNGYTVALILRPKQLRTGAFVTIDPGAVTFGIVASGQVYWDPAPTDLLAKHSPYTMHWKVTDGGGDVIYFPEGDPDEISVAWP